MKNFLIYLSLAALVSVIVWACKGDKEELPLAEEVSHKVVTDWMGLMLKMSKENSGFSPPVAARSYGYTGLALYEGVRPGMPGYKSMAGQITGLTAAMLPSPEQGKPYHWGIVANEVLASIVKACYSNASAENKAAMESLEATHRELFSKEVNEAIVKRSVDFGKKMGEAMVAFAASDGQAECYNTNFPDSYVLPVGPGQWKPTPPAFRKALQPYWGSVRPFMTKNLQVVPAPHKPFSTEPSSPFWKELLEVYHTVKNLTPEQKVIAEFWSDDPGNTFTPGGHSLSILKQILEKENANLALCAEAFAKMGMAVHDAFVSCWKVKYEDNLVRPITLIHEYIDPNFKIPLITPPFPEYTSGHSVNSGAAARILTDLFGQNYTFTDYSHVNRTEIDGSPRTFTSFDNFAKEASISRLYGGIHYRMAIEEGVKQGKTIAENILTLKFRE